MLGKRNKEAGPKSGPASFAFNSPKASAPRFHQRNGRWGSRLASALDAACKAASAARLRSVLFALRSGANALRPAGGKVWAAEAAQQNGEPSDQVHRSEGS